MRFIEKQPQPQQFVDWKRRVRDERRQSATFSMLNGEIKRVLKRSLLEEQGHICCYCGIRIEEQDSHIEHIKPQSEYRNEQLNYQNLVASCLSDRHEEDELRCGHEKGRWYDAALFVSPLDPDCETYFGYTDNGIIRPFASEVQPAFRKAEVTIRKLNLDAYALRRARSEAIFNLLYADELEQEPLSEKELEILIDVYQKRDTDGKFKPFCSAILHVLQKELKRIRAVEVS